MIDGVKTKKLHVHPDERGRLTEMLRSDDDMFIKFGQVYMTTVYQGTFCLRKRHDKAGAL
jgi:dTDP-4-dehydrorhamnose 3,5-epimerase